MSQRQRHIGGTSFRNLDQLAGARLNQAPARDLCAAIQEDDTYSATPAMRAWTGIASDRRGSVAPSNRPSWRTDVPTQFRLSVAELPWSTMRNRLQNSGRTCRNSGNCRCVNRSIAHCSADKQTCST
jgi:hypothetical protein